MSARPSPSCFRLLPLIVVVAMVAAACGGSGTPFATPAETTTSTDAPPVDSDGDEGSEPLGIPEPANLILDGDPASPIAATLMYDDGPIERIEVLGPKPSTNRPPTGALIYVEGADEVLEMVLDEQGRPTTLYLGEPGELRFGFSASTMTVEFVAPDGSTATESFGLDAEVEPQAADDPHRLAAIPAVPAARRDLAVDFHRAVFLHVSVTSDDVPLPNYFPSPYIRTAGCHAGRGGASFTCTRVAEQLLYSDPFLREYRLALTHTASAVAAGVEPSIWPSAEACREALGNDWWVDAGASALTEVTAVTLTTQLFTWLAATPELAAAVGGLTATYLPGVAVAAVVFGFGYIGNHYGEQLFEGGEGTCERIQQQVVAINMLGTTVSDMEFTVQVCIPPIEGWVVDRECREVGPFRPFSEAMATVPGDAATLDRNQLPPLEFTATPDPGSVAGRVVDADGNPIAAATVILSPSGLEATTDGSGSFAIAEVPAGPQTITASAEGFAEATVRIDVSAGEEADATIELGAAATLPLPRTYAGAGTLTISFSFTTGSCTQDGQLIEVTLNPDGSATAIMRYIAPAFAGFYKQTDGSYTMGECQGPGTESEIQLTGTHTLPSASSGERGRVFLDGQVFLAGAPIRLLEGSYDADDMTLEYRFDAFMEGFAESTGLADPRSYGDYRFPLMELVEDG